MQRFFLLLLISCLIFTGVCAYVLPLDAYTSTLSVGEASLRLLVQYSVTFLICAAVPIVIALVIALTTGEDKRKTVHTYLTKSLIFAWVAALFFLWGNWNANEYSSGIEYKQKLNDSETILKQEVERIAK